MQIAPRVRQFVYEHFLTRSRAPTADEISRALQRPLGEVESALRELATGRHLVLLGNTTRILMANPFSALPTPYRVEPEDGVRYYANCAWDAVAFHVMLQQPIRIQAACPDCADPIRVRLEEGRVVEVDPPTTVVHLGVPAARWWEDIVDT